VNLLDQIDAYEQVSSSKIRLKNSVKKLRGMQMRHKTQIKPNPNPNPNPNHNPNPNSNWRQKLKDAAALKTASARAAAELKAGRTAPESPPTGGLETEVESPVEVSADGDPLSSAAAGGGGGGGGGGGKKKTSLFGGGLKKRALMIGGSKEAPVEEALVEEEAGGGIEEGVEKSLENTGGERREAAGEAAGEDEMAGEDGEFLTQEDAKILSLVESKMARKLVEVEERAQNQVKEAQVEVNDERS